MTQHIFTESYPVSFRILNQKNEEKLYLENGPSSGFLEITNNSGDDIFFRPPPNKSNAVGPQNFHFALQFRPGILKRGLKHKITHKSIIKGWFMGLGWISMESGKPIKSTQLNDEAIAVLYFLNQNNSALKKDERLVLPLKQLHLLCEEGTQVTQVELRCKNITKGKNENEVLKSHIRHYSLPLINHRGNPNLPVHVGLVGSDTILNDGETKNKLTLRVSNLQKRTSLSNGELRFDIKKKSKLYLYFETDKEKRGDIIGSANQVFGFELKAHIPLQDNGCYFVHEPMFQGEFPIWEIHPEDGNVTLQPHLMNNPTYFNIKSEIGGNIIRVHEGSNSKDDLLVELDNALKVREEELIFKKEMHAKENDILHSYFFLLNVILVERFELLSKEDVTTDQIENRKEEFNSILDIEKNKLIQRHTQLKNKWGNRHFLVKRKELQIHKLNTIQALFNRVILVTIKFEMLDDAQPDFKVEALKTIINTFRAAPYHLPSASEPMDWINLKEDSPELISLGTEARKYLERTNESIQKINHDIAEIKNSSKYHEHDIFAGKEYQSINWFIESSVQKNGENRNWVNAFLREATDYEKPLFKNPDNPLFQLMSPLEHIKSGQSLAELTKKTIPPTDPDYYKLPNDSCFDIEISNIITNYPIGTTHLYLRFENIPGYWDHTYSIPILKQPLVFKTINEENRIGIGTESPESKLHLDGQMKIAGNNGRILFDSIHENTPFQYDIFNHNGFCIRYVGNGNNLPSFRMNGDNVYIGEGGRNVGGGHRLSVGIEGDNSYALANKWDEYSDVRLKENITPIQDALETVKSLNGVNYTWKNSGENDIGFIAQEVEKTNPNLVHTHSETGFKSMTYGRLTPLLTEAIKEQQKQIERLRKENSDLQDDLSILRQDIEALKEIIKMGTTKT